MARCPRRGGVFRAGATWWGVAAEVRALRVKGVRHAAYLGLPDPELGERAVLCVEIENGRVDGELERRARAALGEIPIDELRVFRHIPRDPRHASKTDLDALRALLARGARSIPSRGPRSAQEA